MRQTTNYSLPSWDADDRILRADFNDLTQKTDTALHDNTVAITAETAARTTAVTQEANARATADTQETAARIAGDLRVRLLDMTTEAGMTFISASLAGIDLSPYHELEVVADIKCSNELHMMVDGNRSYTLLSSSGGNTIDHCAAAEADTGSKNQIRARIFGRNGIGLCSISENISFDHYQQLVCYWSGTMAGIRTLNFEGTLSNGVYPTLEAGGRITIYGLKR